MQIPYILHTSYRITYDCVVRRRYLGISSGWMDKDWEWYPEYDQYYGKPLGRAVETTNPPGWKREFEGCTVTVSADLLNATIAFHNHTR